MPITAPADGLLVIDIGNTRVAAGIWDSDGLHDAHRAPVSDADACRKALQQTWGAMQNGRRAAVLASVNPGGAARVSDLIEEVSGLQALRVRDDLPLPMPVELDSRDEVGVDRICCAAAAFERIGGACAVASFGTALTVDCVSAEGVFLGGTILPGFQLCCDALHRGTAQLPQVTLVAPTSTFGRNTHDAIVNGVTYGLVGALREIVERFATELREWPHLVLTGGNAALVAEHADFVDAVVPDLSLIGIALAHRKAAGQT